MRAHTATPRRPNPVEVGLRGVTAAGLLVDAVIHLQLASRYQLAAPGGIGQGNLFRIEAVAAILGALYVLARGSRPAYAITLLVAASAFGAVVLYRYVNVPALGPIPSMYEPLWFAKKVATAVTEGISTIAALAGLAKRWQSANHR